MHGRGCLAHKMLMNCLSLFEIALFSPTFIVDEITLGFDLITLNIFGQAKSSRFFFATGTWLKETGLDSEKFDVSPTTMEHL